MKMRVLSSTLVVLLIGCSTKPAVEPAKEAPKEAAAEVAKTAEPVKAEAAQPGQEVKADESGLVKTGAPIGHEGVITVSQALASLDTIKGKSVRISGKIDQVCQKKGCWLELAGEKPGEPTLRITAKDYGFFFPIGSEGRQALIEGEISVTEMSIEDAQHIEDERKLAPGEQPKKVTAPVQQVSLVATGAEISPKAG